MLPGQPGGGPATSDGQLPRPDRARRPVPVDGSLKCRLLSIDPADQPPSADLALLWKHTPDIVILPEATPTADRPYSEGGANDYQPHTVDTYLDGIRTVRQVPRGWLGWLNVLYTGLSYGLAVVTILTVFIPNSPFLPLLAITLINLAVANLVLVPLYRLAGAPGNAKDLRSRVGKDGGVDFATTVFRGRVPSPTVAWEQYRRLIGATPPEPVVYGRIVDDHGSRVLQYWLFYYYNDWWNQHEADWEVVMIHLNPDDRPVSVVLSSHLAGTWRSWRSTEPIGEDKDHPTVYVARGSHAMYFNTANGMHYAVLHHPWSVLDMSGQFTVRGSKDSVGIPSETPGTYRLIAIPPEAEASRPCDGLWEDWWWLQFKGRFGSMDGILSPPFQEGGLRWARPVEWASTSCEPDSGSWADLFIATAVESAAAGSAVPEMPAAGSEVTTS